LVDDILPRFGVLFPYVELTLNSEARVFSGLRVLCFPVDWSVGLLQLV
jgi:hypothetical protein